MSYTPHTAADKRAMLERIGARSFEELVKFIPEGDRFKGELNLPSPLSELEVRRLLEELAADNASDCVSFLGGGAYDHFIPATVDFIARRSEFYTAYTPYQAEVSQGTLQATYEFQSQVCELFDMDVSNASMYDGASAFAEACHASRDITKRNKVVIVDSVNPHYVKVVETYTHGLRIPLLKVPSCAACFPIRPIRPIRPTSLSALEAAVDDQTAAVLVQHPNFHGCLEPVNEISEIAHKKGALLLVCVDPISLGLLAPPGAYGADIAVAEGQALGMPLSLGGPYLGIYTCKKAYIRQTPGRLIARTVDRDGKPAYALSLQTREQHIRREKATSNICTNQALCALMANIYLATMGREGIKAVARQCLLKAHYLAEQVSKIKDFMITCDGPFFKEFTVMTPAPPKRIIEEGLREKFLAGIDLGRFGPKWTDQMLIAVTEKRTKQEMDRLVQFLMRFRT
jgi:glycine dehydrogenase subunit 1